MRGDTAQATLYPVPIKPTVAAYAYGDGTEPADRTVTELPTSDALLNIEGSGWRFHVSNDSKSMIEPGVMTIKTMHGSALNPPKGCEAQ